MFNKVAHIPKLLKNYFTFCYINTFCTFFRTVTIFISKFFSGIILPFFVQYSCPEFRLILLILWAYCPLFSFAESKFWLYETSSSSDVHSSSIILLLFVIFFKHVFLLMELSSSSDCKTLLLFTSYLYHYLMLT